MTIRFINQENEEITKLNTELIHVKFKGILSNTAEFPSVVLFLRLNWKIYSYVGNSTVFIYFSWRSLGICYGARCVHFVVLSGRRGTLFFLRAQIYRINSIFIKKTWTISVHDVWNPCWFSRFSNTGLCYLVFSTVSQF